VILVLIVGFVAMAACLAFQAFASAVAIRYFVRARNIPSPKRRWLSVFLQFSALMSLLMIGNVVQVAFWAWLYQLLGAFEDFEAAMYFSGVTFTSLGYGDVVLDGRMRLLAPLQAANGLMMYGITTALFFAIVQQALSKWAATRDPHLDRR
jgi:hypothetical protein